jgi:hypothetical protein
MKWKVISASVRGSSHQRSGLPNQDAVDHSNAKDDGSATVLAVADGHGGARYFRSQVGSTLAVHTAVRLVGEFMANSLAPETVLEQTRQALCPQIVTTWAAAVLSDLGNNPFTEAELALLEQVDGPASRAAVLERPELAYGATLLVVAVIAGRVLYLQLGDGDILVVAPDGTTTRPIVADERLVANQTTSLCQPEAEKEFRIAAIDGADTLPLLVLLSTDGYMNSFRSEEDFLQIGTDYLQILREQGSEALALELPNILADATQQGSGDDITLGILHRTVLRGAQPAAPAMATEVAKPATAKSILLEKLKTEHGTQQQKLTALRTSYEGSQKKIRQLKQLLIAIVVLAIAVLATQHYWRPLIKDGGKHSSPPNLPQVPQGTLPKHPTAHEPVISGGGAPDNNPNPPLPPVDGAAPTAEPKADPAGGKTPPPKSHYLLNMGDAREIPLTVGKTISVNDLIQNGDSGPYAKVKKQDAILKLTNLSHDVWTMTTPGSKTTSRFNPGDSVPLREHMRISLGKLVTVTVSLE